MSIVEPSRARIALILFVSRLSRGRYRRFVDGLGLRGDERVLDFGSGWGENTRLIAQKLDRGGRVLALDVSSIWQAVMKERSNRLNNIDYLNSDIRTAALMDGSFDVIVIRYVLHDITRRERGPMVMELARKLRTGGFIELLEPTKKSHGMPVAEIRTLMSDAGLVEIGSEAPRNEFYGRYRKG